LPKILTCAADTTWLLGTPSILPINEDLPNSTASEESHSWAVDQLRCCTTSHTACNAYASAPLPTRVIDTGGNRVQLHISSGEIERYICLSHCWKKFPMIKTLTSNIEAHKSEITWQQLPKTFQNAISFTRKLGIRYLWIDSLCIVQDDTLDWHIESATMGSIYQSAFLTIMATKSEDGSGGLYANLPETHQTRTLNITIQPTSQEPNPREQTIHARLEPKHFLDAKAHATPAMLRGWILQERLLSMRVLHFGAEEPSWECCETSACQCLFSHDMSFAAKQLTHNMTVWKSMDLPELEASWQKLVEEYCRLELSEHKDIFPAISGMVSQFQTVRKSEYVAGMWRDNLLHDLLWATEGTLESTPGRPRYKGDGAMATPWRAPSWSWASSRAGRGNGVRYYHHGRPRIIHIGDKLDGPRCRVVDVRCEPVGSDPMGELVENKNYLVLCGSVIPATISINTVRLVSDDHREKIEVTLNFHDDGKGGIHYYPDHDYHFQQLQPTVQNTSPALKPIALLKNSDARVYCLEMGWSGDDFVYLVLRRVTD